MSREPFYQAAREVMTKCADRELTGYIAIHSIPNLWYILRRIPENKRRAWLKDVCEILRVAGISHEAVIQAIDNDTFSDLDDCLQDRCAAGAGARYIVTRNVSDFENSEIPAILPEEILSKIKKDS